MDLEDGVALNKKEAARETIVQALRTMDFGRSERLVRVNPLRTNATEEDLKVVLRGHPDGIVVPKVESGNDLVTIDDWITCGEKTNHWEVGSTVMVAIVENAIGFLHLAEICASTKRLQALIFGGEDLAADLGAARTREATELYTARSLLVLHTAAYDLQAIDLVDTDFKDLEWLYKEACQGVQMGYAGKQVIHPAQIESVMKAFTPTEFETVEAEKILKLFEENQALGRGSICIDGRMIDMPVVKRARNILIRAGKLEE